MTTKYKVRIKTEMPKKFTTENTKAVAAKERKKQNKDEATSKNQKEAEDANWKDDDKQLQKKNQKKEAEENKRQRTLQRKAEARIMLEQELIETTKGVSKPIAPVKITRAQIKKTAARQENEEKIETHINTPLVENINRLQIEGEEARTVDEAISILGDKVDVDKHPEKRMKAAYAEYQERRLKELKEENGSLRMSQLKQMIFKEWQKSPENPFNQK